MSTLESTVAGNPTFGRITIKAERNEGSPAGSSLLPQGESEPAVMHHRRTVTLIESYEMGRRAACSDLAVERSRREDAQASQSRLSQVLAFKDAESDIGIALPFIGTMLTPTVVGPDESAPASQPTTTPDNLFSG